MSTSMVPERKSVPSTQATPFPDAADSRTPFRSPMFVICRLTTRSVFAAPTCAGSSTHSKVISLERHPTAARVRARKMRNAVTWLAVGKLEGTWYMTSLHIDTARLRMARAKFQKRASGRECAADIDDNACAEWTTPTPQNPRSAEHGRERGSAGR